MRSIVLRAAAALTLGLAIGAATAAACTEPNLVLGRSQAGAGDNVPYSVSGTDQGASYTLDVNGTGVGSGIDNTADPGTSGSFTMPDLGDSPQTVYVRLVTTHEGNEWPSEKSIEYTVPEPVTAPSSSGAAPSASAAPTKASSTAAEPRSHVRSQSSRHAEGRSHPGSARSDSPLTQATPSPSSQAAAAAGGAARAAQAAAAAGAAAASKRASDAVAAARPFDPPARIAIPGYMLLALALALLSGTAAVGVLVARRRGGGDDPASVSAAPGLWTPPPFRAEATMRAMLVEAELQEMISEQRAAALLGPAEEIDPHQEPEPLVSD